MSVRVLIVDDSAAFRAALGMALGSDPAIRVVGEAGDGKRAVELAHALAPDVVTMDVVMPGLDGLEAARQILAERPVPILLISNLARSDEHRMAWNALRLGVVDVVEKPVLAGPDRDRSIPHLLRLVRAAAEVELTPRPRSGRHPLVVPEVERQVELLTLAASTGGPPALERILSQLPLEAPPTVIAQHLAPSFARGFAAWLQGAIGRPVRVVTGPEPLRAGTVYLAGEHHHLSVRRGVVEGVAAEPGELSPSADRLFESAASAYGRDTVGVVLTGMGSDGARGLLDMRRAGGWTLAQDRDSSVVYGMPRFAIEAGAAREVLSLDEIAPRLIGLLQRKGVTS